MGLYTISAFSTNLIGLVLLLVTVVGSRWRFKPHDVESTCLKTIAIVILCACIIDPAVLWADGQQGYGCFLIVFGGNVLLLVANVVIAPAWMLFVWRYLGMRMPRALNVVCGVIIFVDLALIVANFFTPVMFSIDADNVYHRGAGFWIAGGIEIFFFLSTLLPYISRRRLVGLQRVFPVWALLVPMLIGTAVQALLYGTSLIWPSIAVSFAGVMLCLQSDVISQDALTGMYNRVAFWHRAQKMIDSDLDSEYMIVVSDIENFKGINQRYGVKTGDELLRYVGKSLSAFNNKDALFARYSGDQFIGILRSPKLPANEPVTDLARENDTQPAPLSEGDPSIALMLAGMEDMRLGAPVSDFRVKFGIYQNIDKTQPIQNLCDRARLAITSIKHKYDRPVAFYTPAMSEAIKREQRIVETMDAAIDSHQFKVFYQPKHCAKTGKIVGAEALVRWEHPEYGFMSPGEFLDIFERVGFIPKVDQYVLDQVATDIANWKQGGHDAIPISVNTSRKDYFHKGFFENLSESLDRHGIDRSLIHIEVTESAFVRQKDKLPNLVGKVRDLGLKVELDDFGSGYSSLVSFSSLPIDIVKLDMEFMRDFQKNKSVVESSISLSHELGYEVVAEGVETESQLTMLREMGCDYIQGYCYSRPLSRDDFERYLLDRGL